MSKIPISSIASGESLDSFSSVGSIETKTDISSLGERGGSFIPNELGIERVSLKPETMEKQSEAVYERKVYERPDHGDYYGYGGYIFWVFFFVTLIVFIIVTVLLTKNRKKSFLRGDKDDSESLFGFFLIFSFIFLTLAGYRGFCLSRDYSTVAYTTILFLLILWASVLFNDEDLENAIVINVLLIIVLIWWLYILYSVDPFSSWLILFLIIIFVFIAVHTNEKLKEKKDHKD